jgi:integrase
MHQTDISGAIAPIWKSKHPTAIKCINRIGVVFRAARLMGVECDPFVVDAAKHILGDYHHEAQHIEATHWRDIPALYERLDTLQTSHLCLRWMMLTLVRSDGCRKARQGEIDGSVWTVPADRIKGAKAHAKEFRVPLVDPALRIAELCAEVSDDFLFPGARGRSGISDVALQKALNSIGEAGRPHGFRTSFRTWVQDTEVCSFEVAETILGHSIGNKVERTYARSDLLDQRRITMDKWAAHVTGNQVVIGPLRK